MLSPRGRSGGFVRFIRAGVDLHDHVAVAGLEPLATLPGVHVVAQHDVEHVSRLAARASETDNFRIVDREQLELAAQRGMNEELPLVLVRLPERIVVREVPRQDVEERPLEIDRAAAVLHTLDIPALVDEGPEDAEVFAHVLHTNHLDIAIERPSELGHAAPAHDRLVGMELSGYEAELACGDQFAASHVLRPAYPVVHHERAFGAGQVPEHVGAGARVALVAQHDRWGDLHATDIEGFEARTLPFLRCADEDLSTKAHLGGIRILRQKVENGPDALEAVDDVGRPAQNGGLRRLVLLVVVAPHAEFDVGKRLALLDGVEDARPLTSGQLLALVVVDEQACERSEGDNTPENDLLPVDVESRTLNDDGLVAFGVHCPVLLGGFGL